ncbi:hypothetical protein AB0G15_04245 [Streptosporangium sp. NPDC023825]|uniref:hypothetical protein n=1 Tax=Streptosporangium sp. NPDC023825 TaxID=3154909 RepID=UPI003413CDF1
MTTRPAAYLVAGVIAWLVTGIAVGVLVGMGSGVLVGVPAGMSAGLGARALTRRLPAEVGTPPAREPGAGARRVAPPAR